MTGKCRLSVVFFGFLLLSGPITEANAQDLGTAGDTEAAIARAATYQPGHDFSGLFDQLCGERPPRRTMITDGELVMDPDPSGPQFDPGPGVPPREAWYQEPAKVFDNLYYVGSNHDSMWAMTTSEGIILHDTAHEYMVEAEIVDGLREFGLDPADIKYVIIGHGHSDHFLGARQLQDNYGARIIMAERDWDLVEEANYPEGLKPTKDMVATDGMELTLGDTTLTLYVTPGHTPGTISTLWPLRDGDRRHVGALFGGTAFGFGHYPDPFEILPIYAASARRFRDIAREARADVHLSSHTNYDKTLEKLTALRFRNPGDPHPFVNRDAVENYQTVMSECSDATLEWLGQARREGLNLRHPVESGLR